MSLLSPFKKGYAPSFGKILIPFTQDCFVASLLEIGTAVLEKKTKMKKKIQTNRQTMDDRQSQKVTSSFSSGELTGRESNFLKYRALFLNI